MQASSALRLGNIGPLNVRLHYTWLLAAVLGLWWLALFGYPISEERMEVNPIDGKEYLVQYFERNRFELRPEEAGTPFEVQLGQLGTQLYQEKYGR